MRSLFDSKGSQFRVEIVADPAVQQFIGSHASVLDSSFEKVEMSDTMRRRLTRSNYIFSGLKAFHELHEAFPSLLDENGNRKPFERFLNDVQTIDKTYNANYLRAEFNFVAASAEMAARWESFMEDGDRYNLQYRTQRDGKVRPEHAALDRVTLPPSDPFWADFYPPNGWNCFTGSTPVLTASGWKRIDEIKRGDLVVGGSGKLRKVVGTHAKTVDDELVRIISKRGIATCTKNHRFCTLRGWVAAEELKPGDVIVQIGKNTTFYKIVNAIRNSVSLCHYSLMSLIGQRESVTPLTVDNQPQGGDDEINDVRPYKTPLLERKGFCRQVGGHDFFGFAEWSTQCAHSLRVLSSGRLSRLTAFFNDLFAPERGAAPELGGNRPDKLAVPLVLALANMSALKRKAVVYARKFFSGIKTALRCINPLGSDGLTSMPGLDVAGFKHSRHGAAVDIPMQSEPAETSLLRDIPLFRGIKDIHALNTFNSIPDLIRRTFFHTRYIVVSDKITIKKSQTEVFNLSVDTDESYIVPVGITHNCRCTVVQVRKSKYPATPHDEAMRLGDEALQRDTKGIFRFNPGIERKAVPDYNPYTIRRCRDCDIAKGKTRLAKFIPDNELCQACRYIRTCIEHRRDPNFSSYKKELIEEASIFRAEYDNLVTKTIYQTRKSFKRAISHAWNIEEAEMYDLVNSHISELKFIRNSPLGEGKNFSDQKDIANIQKKKGRGVTSYIVYEITLNDITWIVKTEVYKNKSESVYHIMKKD